MLALLVQEPQVRNTGQNTCKNIALCLSLLCSVSRGYLAGDSMQGALRRHTTACYFMVRGKSGLVLRSHGVLLCQHVMRFTTKAIYNIFEVFI